MPIVHDGKSIPEDPTPFDPDSINWIEQAWDEDVAVRGAIQTSVWIVPAGWTVEESDGPVPVTVGGVEYTNGTRARLSTTLFAGTYTVTNRVTFADGSREDRSRFLKIRQL